MCKEQFAMETADGKQACVRYWVQDRKRNLTLQTSSKWKKLYLNWVVPQTWKSPIQLPLVFRGICGGVGAALCPVPTGQTFIWAQPTFRTSKHTTHQPRSHPLTTERFPIPRRRMAPFTSNQSSISVQQKVWDIILECDVIRADPEVYALTTSLFSLKQRFMTGGRERDRDQRVDETLRKHRAGTKGTCFWPLLLKGRPSKEGGSASSCLQVHPILRLFSVETQDASAVVVSLAEPSAEPGAGLPSGRLPAPAHRGYFPLCPLTQASDGTV